MIPKKIALVSLLACCFLLGGWGVSPTYGVNDGTAQTAIKRINEISELRRNSEYESIIKILTTDMQRYHGDGFSEPRLQNELADIFTYQFGDLESAINIDQALLNYVIKDDSPAQSIHPSHNVAKNTILGDYDYLASFINISAETIKENAKERLIRNVKLLDGEKPELSGKYTLSELQEYLLSVKADISKTISVNATKRTLISRLIRIEYELNKASPDSFSGTQYLLSNDINLSTIDYTEIDFLSLADYLTTAYKKSKNIVFAEMALESIYKPYVNIRNPAKRWKYNKLINGYISTLVSGNYEAGRYNEMLYYANLNKSRMLMEDRLAFNKNKNASIKSIMEFAKGDSSKPSILPDKGIFYQSISTMDGVADLYVDGQYKPIKIKSSRGINSSSDTTLSSRDFGLEENDTTYDQYVDDGLYVTAIINGKITNVEKVSGAKLALIKNEMEESYNAISKNKPDSNIKFIEQFYAQVSRIKNPVIIPDKWTAKHPLEYYMGGNYTRTVNIFSMAKPEDLQSVSISGFFNPTLDLPGSEEESISIFKYFPKSMLLIGSAAKKDSLNSKSPSNIIHLSMHGAYNADNPQYSKLYFNGALRGLANDDKNALYALDMDKINLLKNRDLIFAAACQTGLIGVDESNQSELVGILRPLTANNNRNIILSLWKVDDAATRYFVDGFYNSLAKTRNINKSFMIAKDATRIKYVHPYYWSAFYLSVLN